MVRRRFASLLTAGLLIGATALVAAAPVAANGHPSSGARVLLDGLSSPKGLAIGPRSTLVVGQGAFAAPGPVLKVKFGKHGISTTPLTAPLNVIDVAVTPDGARWLIGGDPDPVSPEAGRHSPAHPRHRRLPGRRPGPGQTPSARTPASRIPIGLAALRNNQVLHRRRGRQRRDQGQQARQRQDGRALVQADGLGRIGRGCPDQHRHRS